MRPRVQRLAAGLAGLVLLCASPAAADITVVGHYQFANGDTLTRPSFYTSKRIRTTLPNGDEIVYNHGSDRLTYVDHRGKRYWEGPRALADSLLRPLRAQRAKALAESLQSETQTQWASIYRSLTDSIKVEWTQQTRKIAGYPCSEYVLTAGSYLRQERWIARSLAMPDFGPEVQNLVIASIMDPLGRGLMKLAIQAREIDGLTLSGRLEFTTLSQQGVMSWEALEVRSGKIPDSAWQPPQDYQRWEPSGAGKK